MTTGNNQDLEYLRSQLTTVLDAHTPPAAPTVAVKRRGRAIRNRRRLGVATALSVAVVAAALVPGLVRQMATSTPISPMHKNPTVTVGTVGRDARPGLIAQGTINGRPWHITLSRQGKNLCVSTSGDLPLSGCSPANSYAAAWPATLNGTGSSSVNALYGIAARQVRRVSVRLSDGVVLNLRAVRFAGHRWIGLELPAKLAVTRVTAYSGRRELAYAIPFTSVRGGLPSVQAWLRPGQPAPRRFVRLIGSGVTIHVGPWGECVVPSAPIGAGDVDCWSSGTRQPGAIAGSGDPAKDPWWILVTVRPQVSYLLLLMTDGSTRRIPVVQVGNARFYAIVITNGPRIASWASYDASGHRLSGGQGAPGFAHGPPSNVTR